MENNICNKHAILEHLSEMFTSMTLEDLRTTCETNKWALDRCIDALIESQKTRRGSLQTTFPTISFAKGAAENLENCADSKINEVVKTIQNGFRVFIIMRGAPGSGKSYLASKILEQSIPSIKDYKTQDFIFSTDDFFYGPSGFYKFRPDKLDEAHLFNQERVRKKALDGWSPIIVDNTNIHIWEMMPYVKMAAENGYILKLVEPTTPWRSSPSKLAMKNKHGVPKDKIQRMLDNFEKTSEENLLKMLKSSYKDCTHRMRLHPPFPDIISNLKIPMNLTQTEQKNSFESNKKLCDVRPATSNWKTFEEETKLFWSDDQKHAFANNKNLTSNKSLLDILKESIVPEVETKTKVELHKTKTQNEDESQVPVPVANLKCHSLNCPNENKSFLMLRQMYPIREPASLWDLFLKCKGDLDWTVDILINEENGQNDDSLDCSTYFENELQCDCSQIPDGSGVNITSTLKTEEQNSSKVTAKPQRERIRTSFKQHQTHQNSNEEVLSIKKKIENIFVFPNKPSSERRVRNIPRKHSTIDAETQTNYIDDDIDDTDSNELLVLTLGETLVEQLHSVFSEELSLFEKLSNNLSTNVFIPRSLAKQLFMVWVESAYNQMEEQNQESMRQDESFARLLKNPDFEDCKETPNNLHEILNSQIPWINLENFMEEELETKFSRDVQTDLATHLTEIKLCEQFPNIPKDTLMDIMKAHDNNYIKTMDLLQNSSSFEDSKELNELLLKTGKQQVTVGSGIDLSDKSKEIFGANFSKSTIDSQATRDELKLIALKEFEETRNIATHHNQLKAECFEKAKEAFQRGNGGVAAYYSQIAGYHKKKIDIYNQKAANCIVEVHRHTQCNPDLLDLHYLHVAEAVQCLDIFIDQHITGLRTSARVYKHVFLITGRGLHSVGGISSIKKRVKTRLKDRNLRWTEVNPGLLKVKLYSSSKHTTHC